jgi:hypothetical protein
LPPPPFPSQSRCSPPPHHVDTLSPSALFLLHTRDIMGVKRSIEPAVTAKPAPVATTCITPPPPPPPAAAVAAVAAASSPTLVAPPALHVTVAALLCIVIASNEKCRGGAVDFFIGWRRHGAPPWLLRILLPPRAGDATATVLMAMTFMFVTRRSCGQLLVRWCGAQ